MIFNFLLFPIAHQHWIKKLLQENTQFVPNLVHIHSWVYITQNTAAVFTDPQSAAYTEHVY